MSWTLTRRTDYVCVSCHAARTEAPDLVGNHFRP